VRFRDVGHVVPFLVHVWMFLSPVGYPVSMIPERYQLLYSLNPMVGVIEGCRWALLGKAGPDFHTMGVSFGVIVVLFVSGVIFFRRMESTFADVV
jgi:lipopolysaccharide transport system permease protein